MNEYSYQALDYVPNYEIALNMSLDQLKFYCTSNEVFNKICTTDEFWHERVIRYHPKLLPYKPLNVSWAQYYIQAAGINQLLTTSGIVIPQDMNLYQVAQGVNNGTIKWIVVVYKDQVIGAILMFPTDKHRDVYQRAVDLLKTIDPNFDPNIRVEASNSESNTILQQYLPQYALTNQRNQSAVKQGVPSLWNNLTMIKFY